MHIGKNQREVISLLEKERIINKSDIVIDKYSKVDIERLIYALQYKELVDVDGEKIIYKSFDNINFNKIHSRLQFYNQILLSEIFKNRENYILISHSKNYQEKFRKNLSKNQSLIRLKKDNPHYYERFINSLITQVKVKIDEIKRRVFNWSEGQFSLNYNPNLVNIVNSSNDVIRMYPCIKQSKSDILPSKERSKLIYEIVFMTKTLINDLEAFSESSKKDYSDLFSVS